MTLTANAKPRQAAVGNLLDAPIGIFAADPDLWTSYWARLLFRSRLIGGVPKDPQLRLAVLATLAETVPAEADIAPASDNGAALASRVTGFKTGTDGLYVEGRQVKAMLKESTNIVFAGGRWGPT